MILDLKGFLINQKLFLWTSEYHFYCQGRKSNMPDFWNCHNHSPFKVIGSFEAAAFLLTNLFSRQAALVRFLAVLPSPICSNSFKKRAAKKTSLRFESNAKVLELIEVCARNFRLIGSVIYQNICFEKTELKRFSCFANKLRPQTPVDCVSAGRSLFAKQENFFNAVFSKQFFARRRHL